MDELGSDNFAERLSSYPAHQVMKGVHHSA